MSPFPPTTRAVTRRIAVTAAILVGAIALPWVMVPAGASDASGPTSLHATAYPVVAKSGGAKIGWVGISATATTSAVDSTLRSNVLQLPSGRIRLLSCIGALPAVSEEPTQCSERVVAATESRSQEAPVVDHHASRADTDVLVVGFVNVQVWSDGTWKAYATSWPSGGAPTLLVAGGTAIDWTSTGAPAPVSAVAGVPAGTYRLTAVATGDGRRATLTVGGERVAEYAVSTDAEVLTAIVRIDDPTDAVAVTGSATVTSLRLEPTTTGFTTRGDSILAADGTAVVPRGVNRPGLNYATNPDHLTAEDFAAMHAAGVDTVRLKLGEHLWVEGHCAHDPAYPAAVDAAVAGITELGMVAMLDLAWTTGLDRCATPGLKAMPDADSVTFWTQVASRYKGNPLVAFNVYNEPHSVSYDVWRNGGTLSSGGEPWPVVGMQTLYDAVRSTGADNLVYVSGTGWAHDLRPAVSHPLDGYGIVLSAHIYNEGSEELPASVAREVEPVLGTYPVVITEFGSKLGATFNRKVIEWADSHGLGWQAFMWAPRSAGAFALFDDWGSYKPSGGGWPVFIALAQSRDAG